jgi:2-acylglycerol O-acyltransferase 2
MGSVSANGLFNILSQSNSKNDPSNQDGFTSNAAVVMIGGAQESLYCRPNNYQFVIKKRKGFIRVAFKTGYNIEDKLFKFF